MSPTAEFTQDNDDEFQTKCKRRLFKAEKSAFFHKPYNYYYKELS